MSVIHQISQLADNQGNVSVLARKINFSPQTLSRSIKAKSGVNSRLIESIVKAFPNINHKWLLTGEGEMFHKKKPAQALPVTEAGNVYFVKNIRAVGGQLSESFGREKVAVLQIPGVPNGAVCYQVQGNSMAETIIDGDIVVGIPQDETDFERLKYRNTYIVQTRLDGVVVKKLETVRGSTNIRAISTDDFTQDYIIERRDIVAFWKVVKVLKNV